MVNRHVDVAVIGAGHAGLNAVKEIRKATDNWVLIDGGTLGTTCARIGCMPSKAMIHVANLFHTRSKFERFGIKGAEHIQLDVTQALEEVRDLRDMFVDLILANSTDEMEDHLIRGYACFLSPTQLQIGDAIIYADATVIATGARSAIPDAWTALGERLLTADNVFELSELPNSVAILGLGPIGLELGQTLSRLGVEVTGIDREQTLARVKDPVVKEFVLKQFAKEFPIWLGQPADIKTAGEKILVTAGDRSVEAERALVALGRCPNLESLRLERLGVEFDHAGQPVYDPDTLQIGDYPIFIAGDATGGVAMLQKAADEGRIAGFNALQPYPSAFHRKTPMSIVFSDPNIASVGAHWDSLGETTTAVGQCRFGPVGRAIITGDNRGLVRLYAEKATGRVLGGAMVGAGCEHLAHLLAWAVQQQMTALDMLRMPFYHPVIEEALQDALHDLADKLGIASGVPRQFEQKDRAYVGIKGYVDSPQGCPLADS